jgi:PqqD family protein of HPr-rel-A system
MVRFRLDYDDVLESGAEGIRVALDYCVLVYDRRTQETHVLSHLGDSAMMAVAGGAATLDDVRSRVLAQFEIEGRPEQVEAEVKAVLDGLVQARLIARA